MSDFPTHFHIIGLCLGAAQIGAAVMLFRDGEQRGHERDAAILLRVVCVVLLGLAGLILAGRATFHLGAIALAALSEGACR